MRDLLTTARAVADPTDELSLVTALRSPLFGLGDDDLWTWRYDGGTVPVVRPDPRGAGRRTRWPRRSTYLRRSATAAAQPDAGRGAGPI